MGVDVLLMRVHQPGTSPRRRRLTEVAAFVDDTDAFARLCTGSGLPMLGRVDPYGSLRLTSVEMDQLTGELGVLQGRVTDATDRRILAEVSELGLRCAADGSTELYFEGD
ncbi:hypothetical protein [Streptomyces fulvoviolaceus]|uniref:hypothetical protein n=1 Tax=Streptomyces fulvoviolaceus TaxID=285535 RepID=UPI0021BFB33D|nr:hypothetical protein [Streptomyces fulvoviolaceus]MCT9081527.1 hypothetical protein [Streptomyces fulvoviolaceus]